MGIQQITFYAQDTNLQVQYRNTFYAGDLSSTHSDGQTVAGILRAFIDDYWPPVQSIAYQWYGYHVREVTLAHVPAIFYPYDVPSEGESTADQLPPQTALYLSLRAAAPPPNKSPKWIGGFTETFCVNGVPTTTLLTAAVSFCADLIDYNQGAPNHRKLCCVRWSDVDDRVVSANAVEGYYVNPLFRTMRSRSVGIGI